MGCRCQSGKLLGVSGDSSGQLRELEWYNFTVDPPVNPVPSPPSPWINLLLLGNSKKTTGPEARE